MKKIKYAVVFLIGLFIILEFCIFPSLSAQIKHGSFVYPQLIEKQTYDIFDNININDNVFLKNNKLLVGDTGISDGLEMTVIDVISINPNEIEWYYLFVDGYFKQVDPNAKLLLVEIKVKNVGKTATGENTLWRESKPIIGDKSDQIGVFYAGQKMKDVTFFTYTGSTEFMGHTVYNGYGTQYPGVVRGGVVGFEVPTNIDLNEAVLKMHGLKWCLSGN